MRATTLLSQFIGLKQTRVQSFHFTAYSLCANVCPTTRVARCSGCGCRCRKTYDRRVRKWRHLDLAGMRLDLRYSLRRVDCRRCGIVAEMVPWAEHDSAFTREFEDTVAYLTQRCDRTTVSAMLRIAWRSVGSIVARVVGRLGPADRLDGLTHIGIDELSYRRHHEYVTVVIAHVRAKVVWVQPGKNADTLKRFFAQLGPERTAKLEAVTIDMSGAYIQAVTEASPQAQLIFDRFHVQRLAHDALDQVRREQVRELKGTHEGKAIKRTRFSLQKRVWNMTGLDYQTVSRVQRTNRPLYRAYLLTQALAEILDGRDVDVARKKLKEWIGWAMRSRRRLFRRVARTIKQHLDEILGYVASGLSNGRTEGLNGKIRTITRRAYGFHSAASLIGLIFLCCSGLTMKPIHKYPLGHP